MRFEELQRRHMESTDAVRGAALWGDEESLEEWKEEERQLRMKRLERCIDRET